MIPALFPVSKPIPRPTFIAARGSGHGGNLATSWTIPAFTLNNGDSMFVYACWGGKSTEPLPSSLIDTAGNTYTILTVAAHSAVDMHGVWYYCMNCIGNASNVITFTTTHPVNAQLTLQGMQFANTLPPLAFDVQSTNAITNATDAFVISTGPFTTGGPGLVLVGYGNDQNDTGFSNSSITPSGFLAQTPTLGTEGIAYRLTTAALVSTTVTVTGNVAAFSRCINVAAFK